MTSRPLLLVPKLARILARAKVEAVQVGSSKPKFGRNPPSVNVWTNPANQVRSREGSLALCLAAARGGVAPGRQSGAPTPPNCYQMTPISRGRPEGKTPDLPAFPGFSGLAGSAPEASALSTELRALCLQIGGFQ
jgi:hypothetical protein